MNLRVLMACAIFAAACATPLFTSQAIASSPQRLATPVFDNYPENGPVDPTVFSRWVNSDGAFYDTFGNSATGTDQYAGVRIDGIAGMPANTFTFWANVSNQYEPYIDVYIIDSNGYKSYDNFYNLNDSSVFTYSKTTRSGYTQYTFHGASAGLSGDKFNVLYIGDGGDASFQDSVTGINVDGATVRPNPVQAQYDESL